MRVQFTKNDLKNMGERCIRLPYADSITPTRTELEELHRAYKQGPKALIKALESVQGGHL